MSQSTKELWMKMARQQYPSYPDSLLEDIRLEHAVEWCNNADNEKARLYDKYVMMKRLMDIEPSKQD